MKFRLIATLCAFSLVTVAASATNLVSNPTFTPASPYVSPGYGPITGWTQSDYPSTLGGFPYLTGSNTSGQPFYDNGTDTAASVGFIQVFPGSPMDILEQEITGLVVGATYTFSYDENSRSTSAPDVEVMLGTQVLSATHLDPEVGGSNPFRLVTDTFVAGANDVDLEFIVTQTAPGNDSTALITNASIVATPEPSSLILLGTGLIGAAGAARRKLRKA